MVLEADGDVIGIAQHDHFAGGHRVPLPARGLMQEELDIASFRCAAELVAIGVDSTGRCNTLIF